MTHSMSAMSRGVGGGAGGAGGGSFWFGVFPITIGDEGERGLRPMIFWPSGEAIDCCSAEATSENWRRGGDPEAESSLSVLRRVNCIWHQFKSFRWAQSSRFEKGNCYFLQVLVVGSSQNWIHREGSHWRVFVLLHREFSLFHKRDD